MYYYRAFSWNIASEIEFPELLAVPNCEPDVQISYHVSEGHAVANAAEEVGAQISPGNFQLNLENGLSIRALNGSEVRIYCPQQVDQSQVRIYVLGSAFGAIAHQRGVLPMHASAIEVDGKGYLFCGKAGGGKSTAVGEFFKRGYRVYSDDLSIVTFDETEPILHQGTVRLKLWKDSLDLLGIAPDLNRVRQGIEKYSLPMDVAEPYDPIPIAGLISLNPINLPDPQILPIGNKELLRTVLMHTFRQRMVRKLGVDVGHFKLCEVLSKKIKGHQYKRPVKGYTVGQTCDLLAQLIHEG